jgi:hypothetical protein
MSPDPQILAPRAFAGDPPDPRRWLTLAVLLLAAFMNLLDSTTTGLPAPLLKPSAV